MKLIQERVFNSDVHVMIADKGETPLLVAGDYKQLMTVTQAENQWMLNNGYERVGAVNCGFFNMSSGEMLGQCLCDWTNIKASETGWEDGYVDLAFDGSSIKVGDMSTFEGCQWVRTLSWGIVKDGVEWTLGRDKYTHDTTYQPRTMIGRTYNNEPIAIVVDGRNMASKLVSGATSTGITVAQQVELAKRYNCKDLVNADGGGSSVFEYNGVIKNNPSDGTLRKCSDFVVFYKKKETQTDNGGDTMNKFKLVLDAGHGYNTAGKRTPDNIREWYLNDRVCNFIEEKLRAYEGVEVYRTDDITGVTDIALAERVSRCNAINPDVMISIHHNATGSEWVEDTTGTEVYWHTYGTQEDKRLAEIVASKLSAHTGLRNRGVKQASFAVLGCNATAILCESGFMNSRIDHPVITTWGQEEYANAIVASLVEAYGLVKTVTKEPEVETVTEPEATPEVLYRVIAGAYGVKANADKTVEDLKAKGYTGAWIQTIQK